MNIFNIFRVEIYKALERLKENGSVSIDAVVGAISVEPPRDSAHGDIATNVALVLAAAAQRKPRDLAELLIPELEQIPDVASVEIAGPGFLNFRLRNDYWRHLIKDILDTDSEFGRNEIGEGQKVLVEFVSANPTGPLHVGHGRGAVAGILITHRRCRV